MESIKSKQKNEHYPTKIKEISDDNDRMKSVISQYESILIRKIFVYFC